MKKEDMRRKEGGQVRGKHWEIKYIQGHTTTAGMILGRSSCSTNHNRRLKTFRCSSVFIWIPPSLFLKPIVWFLV